MLDEPWKRLIWARKRWQRLAGAVAGTAKEAALSLGMKEGTYRAYERAPDSSKHIPLDHQAAVQFGRKYKVSWVWLLTGEGSPFEVSNEFQDRVLKTMANLPDDQQAALADMAEVFSRAASARR